MSTTLPNLTSLRKYHNMMLLHTYNQIRTVLDSQASGVTYFSAETSIVRVGENEIIANTTPIIENRPYFASACEGSSSD